MIEISKSTKKYCSHRGTQSTQRKEEIYDESEAKRDSVNQTIDAL